jgi:hypothetical protein
LAVYHQHAKLKPDWYEKNDVATHAMSVVTVLMFFVIVAMVAYAVRCRFFSPDCMFCKGVRGSSDLSGKAAAASPASQQSDDQVHAAPRPLTVRVRHDGTGPGPDTEVFEALRAPRANALQPRPLLNTHVDNDDDDARSKGASGSGDEVSLKWRYI